jgi:hypothetical protein
MHKIKALLVVCSKHLKFFKLVFERLEFCLCHLLSSRFRKTALFQHIPQSTIYEARKSASANIQYDPGLSLDEENCFFFILRKNLRGITFFASSETPISVIKISVLIHCILKLTFFDKI